LHSGDYLEKAAESRSRIEGRAQANGPAGENLQQVPIAVTAIEGSTALALGVTDMTDLHVDTTGLIMRHQNKL